jgi:hypothetical protein
LAAFGYSLFRIQEKIAPGIGGLSDMNILNSWKIIHSKMPDDGRYVPCIEGLVASSNPRFPEASTIRTSYLTCYEMQGASMVVITARGSEYLLATSKPSERFAESFLKSILPERQQAPQLIPKFDPATSHVIALPETEFEGNAPAGSDPVDPK